jgi:hypothetical protein
LPAERISEILLALSFSEAETVAEFAIRVYREFDGRDGRPDCRVNALSALQFLKNPEAKRFIKRIAEENKDNEMGDRAIDNFNAGPRDIPFVLRFYSDPETCFEARVSALNTLANAVQHYGWDGRPIPKKLRKRLVEVARGALSHEAPYMRAFGCRLAGMIPCCKTDVERLTRDKARYFAKVTVSEEATSALMGFKRTRTTKG